MTSTAVVLAAVAAIFTNFDQEAAKKLLEPNYIQHNPYVPTGAEAVIKLIPDLKASNIKVTNHRVITDGDFVALHNTYENAKAFGAPTLVAFDVFRVKGDKVAEHWDNLQPPCVLPITVFYKRYEQGYFLLRIIFDTNDGVKVIPG